MTRAAGQALLALQDRLGHRFARQPLLELALIHSSASERAGGQPRSNERLEFLGDALIGFLVADRLWRDPTPSEGEMSRLRAAVVCGPVLASCARDLGLGECLHLGRGEARGGGRQKESILAAAFEAVLAAVYLDAGLEAAAAVLQRALGPTLAAALQEGEILDPKTELQEHLQAAGGPLPVYELLQGSGPSHAPHFQVEVRWRGKGLARGEGGSRKAAEQVAARRALELLGE